MMDNSHSRAKDARTIHADSTNETVEAGEITYGTHTARKDADCRARRRKRANGNDHIAAAGPSRVKGVCSAYNLPEGDDQPELPYISFTMTEAHSTAAIAEEQSHKVETWPFGSLSASRPWRFEE